MTLPALSGASTAICLFSLLLIPLALSGIALINTGLGRSRSAAHMMLSSLCVIGVAAGVYVLWGFALQGTPALPAHNLIVAGKSWNVVARVSSPLHVQRLGYANLLDAWFGMMAVALAALIPLGAGADRWRLAAMCASTALFAGITFPLFAHDVWGGGWLAQLGVNSGLGGGFLDAGGSGVIQAVGGLTALSIVWVLGPRRGKYTNEGVPTAIPGHNVVYVLVGCILAWIGWLGLNSAGSLLFAQGDLAHVVLAAINTTLSAGSGALAAAALTRYRFRRPDTSLTANGWISGLVASSAACSLVTPLAAIIIGVIAGLLVVFSIEWLESRLGVDDPGGAVSVHGLGGIWGLLAAGLFAQGYIFGSNPSASARFAVGGKGQWLAQLLGVATLLGFVLPLTYGLNWLLNRFYRQRVDAEGERQGMDLYELGGGAYPEFVTRGDEFGMR